MPKPLLIEIASDVICPWCYIGKRRLEKALASLKGEVEVAHRMAAVPAQPGHAAGASRAPTTGAPSSARWKKGARSTRAWRRKARARASTFAFDRMQRTPNTVAAHQLIDLAQTQGKAGPVVDALFRAYFEEAKDIGDAEVLAGIAEAAGVDGLARRADAPQRRASRKNACATWASAACRRSSSTARPGSRAHIRPTCSRRRSATSTST